MATKVIILAMPWKPLVATNPYLKDPRQRERLLKKSVITSTAIEGVQISVGEPESNKSQAKGPRRHRRRIR
jgi:hypothetical protein